MRTVCKRNMCTGCMACVSVCQNHAISIRDSLQAYNAVIDTQKCVNCGACERVCQSNQIVEPPKKTIEWHQGWAIDKEIREKASSGGAATALMRAFVQEGGIVCGCVYHNGVFEFGFAKQLNEVDCFAGSKYIKSNPQNIYKQLRQYLKDGERVLFVGLPCQVAAIKNFVGTKFVERLYTVDLICHGTPSPQILEMFLNQYGMRVKDQSSFTFRDKDMFQISASGKYIAQKGAADRYSIAFLNGLTYTENCYACKYACLERVSDITLGDSWGSELELSEQKKGLSLLLVQTEKGQEMLKKARIHLETVDLKKAIAANHQLEYPSTKCLNSERFWKDLKKGKKFNTLVLRAFPRSCMRQKIKEILLKLKIIYR